MKIKNEINKVTKNTMKWKKKKKKKKKNTTIDK